MALPASNAAMIRKIILIKFTLRPSEDAVLSPSDIRFISMCRMNATNRATIIYGTAKDTLSIVTPEKLPIKKSTLLTLASGTTVIIVSVKAENILDTAIPERTIASLDASVFLAIKYTIVTDNIDPKNADMGAKPIDEGKNAATIIIERPAPELTPIILGLHIGFPKTVCRIVPEQESAAPDKTAARVLGSLTKWNICMLLLFVLLSEMIFHNSCKEILTAPTQMLITIKTIRLINEIHIIVEFLCAELWV